MVERGVRMGCSCIPASKDDTTSKGLFSYGIFMIGRIPESNMFVPNQKEMQIYQRRTNYIK